MLIDTHCHLDFKDFDKDRDDVIRRANDKDVSYIITVGSSLEGSKRSLGLAERREGVFASVGIHPHGADVVGDDTISQVRHMAGSDKVIAIGEVGLDYHEDSSPTDLQKSVFIKFIRLSLELDLPLIIHNREANKDTLDILRREFNNHAKGVMHCFSGDVDFLNKCLDLGLHISFTCNITFKNAGRLREIATHAPLERLLLETDAPFLAPQAKRGQRNEPSYLTYLVEELARLKGVGKKQIEEITTKNAFQLFNLKC